MEKLTVRNISKCYNGEPTIEDVSLYLSKGETVSLLGMSGVGKTTLFNVINGLIPPDSGGVFLDSLDVTGLPGRVGYMLQKDMLMPYKTIADNIALPLVLKGMKKDVARGKAVSYFGAFSLNGNVGDKYPHQLSGGMRQRAALLRTFLTGCDVMLLDEPFSALDALIRRQMQSWFMNIAKEFSLSSLFITHDAEEAVLISDRVYIMAGTPGRITSEIVIDRSKGLTEQAAADYKKQIIEEIGVGI